MERLFTAGRIVTVETAGLEAVRSPSTRHTAG
jgi:hypothetical protein